MPETVEARYRSLIENMMNGFAYHKVIFDEYGKPVDYVFLEVNKAFERLTGLKRDEIIGKKVTEVLPGIDKDPADWIGVYGMVTVTGQPIRFENYARNLKSGIPFMLIAQKKGILLQRSKILQCAKSLKRVFSRLRPSTAGYTKLTEMALYKQIALDV